MNLVIRRATNRALEAPVHFVTFLYIRSLLSIAAIALLLLVGACRPAPRHAPCAEVLAGTDDSNSFTPAQREEGLDLLWRVVKTAPRGAIVRISLFSGRGMEDPKYDDPVERAGDLRPFHDFYLNKQATGATHVSGLLRAFAAEARRIERQGGTVIIVLVTDAGFSDMDAVAAVAQELAAIHAVRAVIIGPVTLQQGVQAEVVRAFKPLDDSGRLIIVNPVNPASLRRLQLTLRQ